MVEFSHKKGVSILCIRALSKFLIFSVYFAFNPFSSFLVFLVFSVLLLTEILFTYRLSQRSEFVYLIISTSLITLLLSSYILKYWVPILIFISIDFLSILSVVFPYLSFLNASIGFIFLLSEFPDFLVLKTLLSEIKKGEFSHVKGSVDKIEGNIQNSTRDIIFRKVFSVKKGVSIVKGEKTYIEKLKEGEIVYIKGTFFSLVDIDGEKFTIISNLFDDQKLIAFIIISIFFIGGIPLISIFINPFKELRKERSQNQSEGEKSRYYESAVGTKISIDDRKKAGYTWTFDEEVGKSGELEKSEELEKDEMSSEEIQRRKDQVLKFIQSDGSADFSDYKGEVSEDVKRHFFDYFVEIIQRAKEELAEDKDKVSVFASRVQTFEREVKELASRASYIIGKFGKICEETLNYEKINVENLKSVIPKFKESINQIQEKLSQISSNLISLRNNLYLFEQVFSLKFRELEYLFHEFFSPLGGIENDIDKTIPLIGIDIYKIIQEIKEKFDSFVKSANDFLLNMGKILEGIQLLAFNSEVRAYKIKDELPTFEILSSAIGGMLNKMEEIYREVQRVIEGFQKSGIVLQDRSSNLISRNEFEELKNALVEMKKITEEVMGGVRSFSYSVIDNIKLVQFQVDKISKIFDFLSESIPAIFHIVEYTENLTVPIITVALSDISRFFEQLQRDINEIISEDGREISGHYSNQNVVEAQISRRKENDEK